MRMENLYNDGPHGSLHQLGDKVRKSFRAVDAKSGVDEVHDTDSMGDGRLIRVNFMLLIYIGIYTRFKKKSLQ